MQVLFLTGPSAVGKSSVSRALQRLLGEPWLFYEVDRCQPTPPPDPAFATVENDRALHRATMAAAKTFVDAGFRVIIETDLGDENREGARRELFRDVDTAIVVLTSTRETVQQRAATRNTVDVSSALQHFDNASWDDLAADLHVATDGRSAAEVASTIARFLRGRT